jgi:hypothetical protein
MAEKVLSDRLVLVYPKRDGRVWFARHKRGPFLGKLSGYGGESRRARRRVRRPVARSLRNLG